ncbi:hypothetical protein [Nocardia puris]|uniref:Zinc-binding alcohol dehydrogenase family protein n=1 Tax=Nocardia puris TaxID=208602 RepID=A0A366DAK8_9NOCA|nr:hypothetical protein [Nocardia puris]RBO86474.1 hypothetical protein DFR74_11316 [Nocardia puris]
MNRHSDLHGPVCQVLSFRVIVTLETTLAHVCDPPAALQILTENLVLGREFAEPPVGLAHLGACLDRLATGRVEGKVLIDPAA